MVSELSVIISALNEEKAVRQVLIGVLEIFDRLKIKGDIIFLNNHSTDNTGKIADTVAKRDKRVKVIHRINRKNKDLGSSLKEGILHATGNYILIMDCDMSHNPAEIKNLFDKRKEADIIVGSRYSGGSADIALSRNILSKTCNYLINYLFGLEVKDISNSFKLYKKEVLKSLKLTNDGFGLHVEIILKAANRGYVMKETPIHLRRSLTDSKMVYRKQIPLYAKAVFAGIKDKFMI